MTSVLLLLPVLALVWAGPAVPSGHMNEVADAMLKNLNSYASLRNQHGGEDALNNTFALFYTDSDEITRITSMRRCIYSNGIFKSDLHTFGYDPNCQPMVEAGSAAYHYSETYIPQLIREIDANRLEKKGSYNLKKESGGISKLNGEWIATQRETQKTMVCDVTLKFKDVGSSEVGLVGMMLDCPTCDFGEPHPMRDLLRTTYDNNVL